MRGSTETTLLAAAGALWTQYGGDAVVVATLRSAEQAAMGDLEASDYWLALAEVLEAMSSQEGGERP